jgi:hypothetical protein
MSEKNLLKPGEFKINLFQLNAWYSDWSLDISQMIYQFSIKESLNLSSIRGNATIVDANNLLNLHELSGEELINLSYQDAMGNTREALLSLYAISDVKPNEQGTGKSYQIHFTSVQKFASDSKRISKSYRGTIKEIAQTIYGETFILDEKPFKPFLVSDMDGIHQLIIPNMSPCSAMEFLARRSYSSDNVSQTYRFFESLDAYHLESIEDIVERKRDKKVWEYSYDPMVDNDGKGLAKQMSSIIDIDFPNVSDSYSAMMGGQYKRSVRELDVISQNVLKHDLVYSEVFDDVFSIGDDRAMKHSQEFRTRFLENDNVTSTIIRDYSEGNGGTGIRHDTYYSDIINHKAMMFGNVSESKCRAKIYGRVDMALGDIFSVNVLEMSGDTVDRKLDRRLGGKYMVESISHEFIEENFVQVLELSRNDWGKV